MADETYAFIDGGHLRHNHPRVARDWFGVEPSLNPNCFRNVFHASKVFYYDSLPEPEKGENPDDYQRRVSRQEELFRGLKRAYGTHVREGILVGGKKTSQKQVDILLAVDAMTHAVRGNMKNVALVTGDQDFKPLVEALVGLGLHVHLWGDLQHTSNDLADAADVYVPMSLTIYHSMTDEAEKKRVPLPRAAAVSRDDCKLIREGTVGGMPAELLLSPSEAWAVVIRLPAGEVWYTHRENPRLLKFCELEYGPVVGLK